MENHRSERLSEALREELDEMIGYELADPRIQDTSVAEVMLSPDGKRAHVRMLVRGDAVKQQDVLDALEHARHYLRRELAARLDLFRVPDLHFEAAFSAELGPRVKQLLRRVRRRRPRE